MFISGFKMKLLSVLLIVIIAGLFLASRYFASQAEARFPPKGQFADVAGQQVHYVEYPAGENADLIPMIFIHGASANLRDLESAIAGRLEGRGRMIFLDRPGHGYSQRGMREDVHLPWGQAALVSGLLDHLGIAKAIVIGHSYGGSVAASFAVNHPEQTAGLVFLAPATHPWPGGDVTWYYDVTSLPVVGWLFSELLAVPAGQRLYHDGVKSVFKPQKVPENYEQLSATRLVLRPDVFRNNASDVSSLYDAVTSIAPRYSDISVPTSIITGDSDDIVLAEIHSKGLEQDIAGANLVWLEGVGHSPLWTNPDVVISEIERVSEEAGRQ